MHIETSIVSQKKKADIHSAENDGSCAHLYTLKDKTPSPRNPRVSIHTSEDDYEYSPAPTKVSV